MASSNPRERRARPEKPAGAGTAAPSMSSISAYPPQPTPEATPETTPSPPAAANPTNLRKRLRTKTDANAAGVNAEGLKKKQKVQSRLDDFIKPIVIVNAPNHPPAAANAPRPAEESHASTNTTAQQNNTTENEESNELGNDEGRVQAEAPQQPKKSRHREKVTNGLKHELALLAPTPMLKVEKVKEREDGKRALRSQEGVKFKSELSAYFPDYDEVVGNEVRESHYFNFDTPIMIVDSAPPKTEDTEAPRAKKPRIKIKPKGASASASASSSPTKQPAPSTTSSSSASTSQQPIRQYPSSLTPSAGTCTAIDFTTLLPHLSAPSKAPSSSTTSADTLPDSLYTIPHRRHSRLERSIRSTEKAHAQHESLQIARLLEGLEGGDWLRVLGVANVNGFGVRGTGVMKVMEMEKQWESKRRYFIDGCRGLLGKFERWRREERRRKGKGGKGGDVGGPGGGKRDTMETSQERETVERDEEQEEDGDVSDGDPPDYSDIDASAARQLHAEAVARSAASSPHPSSNARANHRIRIKLKHNAQSTARSTAAAVAKAQAGGDEQEQKPAGTEGKRSKSFYADQPHLRGAALGKLRRGRSASAWGKPIPVGEREFELPEGVLRELEDGETVLVGGVGAHGARRGGRG